MKRHRYIAALLLLASMWMLVVTVVPHHHHSFCESVCMQKDADEDIAHHGDQNDDLCHTTCVTNIRTVSPDRVQEHLSPDYTYFTDLFLWVEHCVMASLVAGDDGHSCTSCYVERLHARCGKAAYGRRGPPMIELS